MVQCALLSIIISYIYIQNINKLIKETQIYFLIYPQRGNKVPRTMLENRKIQHTDTKFTSMKCCCPTVNQMRISSKLKSPELHVAHLIEYYLYKMLIISPESAQITFSTFLVIFPKELGMMSSTGLVEWLEVLRLFW